MSIQLAIVLFTAYTIAWLFVTYGTYRVGASRSKLLLSVLTEEMSYAENLLLELNELRSQDADELAELPGIPDNIILGSD